MRGKPAHPVRSCTPDHPPTLFPPTPQNRNAKAMLATWPEYAGKASPLVAVPDLAAALGVASIQIKCEGGRFGIGSFKALGAPYAVAALLKRQNKRQVGGEAASGVSDLSTQTFSTASDGNHGVAVAWAARRFGASARVYDTNTTPTGIWLTRGPCWECPFSALNPRIGVGSKPSHLCRRAQF